MDVDDPQQQQHDEDNTPQPIEVDNQVPSQAEEDQQQAAAEAAVVAPNEDVDNNNDVDDEERPNDGQDGKEQKDDDDDKDEPEPEQEQETEQQRLDREIFGDSESELSAVTSDEEDEDEDEGPTARKKARAIFSDEEEHDERTSPGLAASSRSPTPDETPSDKDDDGDEYRGDEEGDINRLKFKKKKKSVAEGGEGEAASAEPRKKKKKKVRSERAEQEIVEEQEVDPEVARRRNLDARIQDILKPSKSRAGGKKRKNADEDDLDAFNDEKVAELRQHMLAAADSDISRNDDGRFASEKLKMLPTVVEMMQRAALAESLVENGVLEAVRRWLEPLPDKSLPAVNIQRALFEILRTLSIETSALKSSGLGKVVYFYTKCKRVEPFIARMANQLVSDWMRPIIRRSKAFVDKDPFADAKPDNEQSRGRIRAPAGTVGTTAKTVDDDAGIARRHARIPEQLTASFTIAPPTSARDRQGAGGGLQSGAHSITAVSSKMKGYKKKLVAGQQASRRV